MKRKFEKKTVRNIWKKLLKNVGIFLLNNLNKLCVSLVKIFDEIFSDFEKIVDKFWGRFGKF